MLRCDPARVAGEPRSTTNDFDIAQHALQYGRAVLFDQAFARFAGRLHGVTPPASREDVRTPMVVDGPQPPHCAPSQDDRTRAEAPFLTELAPHPQVRLNFDDENGHVLDVAAMVEQIPQSPARILLTVRIVF